VSGRGRYSDEDKAAVLAAYHANGGNLLRTAKETGVSRNTIRHWLEEAPPPDEVLQAATDAFVATAQAIRTTALDKLQAAVEAGDVKPRELITIIGVLDDKIVRSSGLPTSRTEHVGALPSRDELQLALEGAVKGMIADAERRDQEIIDAEYVVVPPPRALPAPARTTD
jgi:transposase-like protein